MSDEQPPAHQPGDRIHKAVDPVTGISIRMIRQWQPPPTVEEQRALDRQFFEALRANAAVKMWQSRMTPAGLRELKRLRISPE